MKQMLRKAEVVDFDAIATLDKEVIETTLVRSEKITRAIRESRCNVVISSSTVQGFAISNPKAFKGMDFLELVVVNPSTRRLGIATLLISRFRESSNTPECWTSTNQSNQAMITLLRKLGWYESDHVEELDLGDPELFFYIN
jgi:N-acetylglutamate synthase-like GNAT family acetyltransferase